MRRETGILGAWADLFSRSLAADLKPWRGSSLNVHASTGFVGQVASENWGSNQAAAALAIWSTTKRVFHYPETYNVPHHSLANRVQHEVALPRPHSFNGDPGCNAGVDPGVGPKPMRRQYAI